MMNKYRGYSQIAIVVTIVGVLLFDAWVFVMGGQDATISSVIITDWAYNYPAFTFLAGFVCGHLWWPLSKKKHEGIG